MVFFVIENEYKKKYTYDKNDMEVFIMLKAYILYGNDKSFAATGSSISGEKSNLDSDWLSKVKNRVGDDAQIHKGYLSDLLSDKNDEFDYIFYYPTATLYIDEVSKSFSNSKILAIDKL
jgi:ABC-type microcin C transport system permease subunit YejB